MSLAFMTGEVAFFDRPTNKYMRDGHLFSSVPHLFHWSVSAALECWIMIILIQFDGHFCGTHEQINEKNGMPDLK